MAKPAELIGIGEFARRVRLSVKQLRSYDELGLLAPAYVDPDSGYRYYHRGQARTAITIALLRSLDVPLSDVHELLVADEGSSLALLERQRRRIERELARGRQVLRALERLMAARDLLPYDVAEREDPARELVGLRGTCDAEALDRAAPALIEELDPAAGVPVVGLYPVELEGEIDFFVGVEDRHAPGLGAGAERVRLGPARVAATVHVGPHEELQLAYFPLLAYAEERGLTALDAVRETYIDDPGAVPPDALRTEVALPIRPTEEITR